MNENASDESAAGHTDRTSNRARWTDAELDELLGVHALDAVDDEDERAAVEAYVARSPRARAELDSHRHVASAIGNSVVTAPSELWNRIASQLNDEAPVSTPAPVAERPLVALPKRRWSRGSRRPNPAPGAAVALGGRAVGAARPWAAAAAAAMIAAVASMGIALDRNSALRSATAKNQSLRSDVAVERTRSSQLRGQLDQLAQTSPVALRVAQLESDPTARNVQLVSSTGASVGHVLLAANGEGYIIGDAIPPLTAGRTYQLWGVKDGIVLSLGVVGRSPKAVPFAGDEQWSQLVLTEEASPGVVSSTASAAAVATLDQA